MMKRRFTTGVVCLLLLAWRLPSSFAAATKEEDYKTVDGQGSWESRYDVSTLPSGKYNLIIEGTDRAGNSAVAGPFNVYVDPNSDLPVAGISSPSPGQRVGGDLTVVGTCVDDDGVDRVEVSLDKGDFAPAEGQDYWSVSLPLGTLADGPHTVSARGVDVNGVSGTAVTVKFNLDTRAPVVRVTSHQNGALVGGTLSLAGTVEDLNGVKSLAWSADRTTFLPLRVQAERGGTTARFALAVDTRKLKDGPHVYWFSAGDLTGSVGAMPFLFFVDNTAPVLQVLSPAPDRKVSGVVTVVGKISELVGVKSLSWNAGDAGSGAITLVPGNPYWVQDIDLGKAKGSSARVSFIAVDNAGNSATKQLALALLPDEADLPVVLVRSPITATRYGSVVPLVGTVRDDDGVKAVAWSLDGKPPVTFDAGEAFTASLAGVAPGKHRLAVHGIDVNGRPGRDVVIDFVGVGDAPTSSIDALIIGTRSVPFRPGQEIARDAGAVLHGRVASLARIQSAGVSFGGGAEEKAALKPGGPGETLFDVKVPAAVPFGLVAVTMKVTDEYGQTSEVRTTIHVRNDTLRGGEPGIQFFDGRIGADGSVALGAGGPLAGIMAGEEIGSISLEPSTDVVSVSAEGDRVLVSPTGTGTSVPVRVKVVSKKGHVFTSDAYTFVTEASGAPAAAMALGSIVSGKDSTAYTPGMRLVLGQQASISGTVTLSPGTVKTAEYSLSSGTSRGASRPLTVPKPDKSGVAAFSVPLPADLPRGRADLRISVTDDQGRRSELLGFFYRTEPDPGNTSDAEVVSFVDARIAEGGVVLLAPGESLSGYFNGRPVASVAIEPEAPFLSASFEGNVLGVTALAEGMKDGVRVRVTTVDGDSFASEALSFHADATPPDLAVTSPLTGAWTGTSVKLAGTAKDSNGLASLEYSVGQSGTIVPLALPGAGGTGATTASTAVSASTPGSFEIVLDLTASPDGDVPVVLRARDLAGRSTAVTLVVMKDTQAPQLAMLTPPEGDPVNGIVTLAGSASDEGIIEKVELSTDGTTWTAVPGAGVFSAPIDLSKVKPEQVSFRVTDRGGNAAAIVPPMNVHQAADVPDLQVQVPQEGDVQRDDFVISGTVFDDDGVGAILYRIDNGDWARMPGANTFSIPVALADITDNEHIVELKAEDLNGVTSEPRTSAVRVSKAEPLSKLVTPPLSATARGVVALGGESSDRNGIAEVSLSFDNGQSFRAADGKETWGYRLDTRLMKDGTYSVIVRAADSYGTQGLASTLLKIDNTPPDIVLDSPADGGYASGTLTVAGRARDDIAVTALRARIRPLGSTVEPLLIELPAGGPFSRAVDLAALAPGWYDLSVEGTDKAANSSIVSRNVLVEPGSVGERLDIWFPGNGEEPHDRLDVSGRLISSRTPTTLQLMVDGTEAATTTVKDGGFFSAAAPPESLADGAHSVLVEARFTEGPAVRSEERRVTWHAWGPWVRVVSHSVGDWVRERPFISGEAGRTTDPAEQQPSDAAAARRVAEGRKLLRVEVSLDNGRTFAPAQGTAQWKYRLETLGIADGPVRLLVKALYADGASAVDQTILRLDDTPPQVQLLSPREEGRFNGEIAIAGTAADENGVALVRAAVRKGDKASYEVPTFIQGLYFDGHALGATEWDVGLGLTFFDQNVKLQAQVGMAPPGRFSGYMVGAKLLANIVRLPFSYFLGPDLDFLSLSFAVGANFSYVADQQLILGAVVGQLEFPIFRFKTWPAFNTWSLYTEYQLWFISSDISAGLEDRLSFGARVGLF